MSKTAPAPWRVDRWSDKAGRRGISILDANGLALLNMVGQLDDNEGEIAKRIVRAVNELENDK